MSMDRCQVCDEPVDTDLDTDCYDNPAERCACVRCREAGKSINGWMNIETAPLDRDVELAAWIAPSRAAARNGSRPYWTTGKGRHMWNGKWSGILGMEPSHWRGAA